MDIVGIISAVLGSGLLSGLLTYRLSNKKADQDGFTILFEKLEADNRRLREEEEKNAALIRDLQRKVDDLTIKLQLMESAHNDLPVPQWLKDTHGRMLSINDPYTQVFGKTREEYIGNTDWEVWDKQTARQFTKNDSEVYRTRKVMHTIEMVPMPNGASEEWEIMKYPRYAGNIIIGIGGIAWKRTGSYSIGEPS